MLGVDFRGAGSSVMDVPRLRAAGKSFAFVRATFGVRADPGFARVWPILKQSGMRRGAIHVYRPGEDAIAQAVQYLKAVQLKRGDLPPVLDVETEMTSGAQRPRCLDVREWLSIVESELEARHGHAIRPMIQTSERSWRWLDNPSGFDAYPLWVVDPTRLEAPRAPVTWGAGQWTVHKYAKGAGDQDDDGRAMDLDRFNLFKLGDRGKCILRIKELLRQAGYDAGRGGDFDDAVQRQVLRFQASRDLAQHGIVDADTFAELQWQ